jgi:molybdenum cofactor cytidylyltransferase
MSVSAIILAAGSSSRMGQSKQLLPWGNGTLLSHAVGVAIGSRVDRVFVVLGDNETAHRESIEKLPVTIVVNQEWQKGIGSSLKAGVNEARKVSDAILIMVCDMPFVTPDHLDKMMEASQSVVASKYLDTVGVPALFRKEIFDELMMIGDEEGARKVIANHKPGIASLGSGTDLDTPEDYQKALPD